MDINRQFTKEVKMLLYVTEKGTSMNKYMKVDQPY